MKILHAPVEVAGQLGLTALGQREIGHVADTYARPHPFRYPTPPTHSPKFRGSNQWLRTAEEIVDAFRLTRRYDVIHFHFGQSFLPEALKYLDARALRRCGKNIAMEFHGSDARLSAIEGGRNPYYVDAYREAESVTRERLRRWAEITGGRVIFADHSFDAFLSQYFPRIDIAPLRVDTRRLAPVYPDPEQRVPRVVHAPSNRAVKGTERVQRAVERLKARGLKFEYTEVHAMPHAAALQQYRRADIVVDQLRLGSHGTVAAEAMSLGKPVICYILPALVPTFPSGFPIINANPDTIESTLEEWIQRAEDRYHLGVRSRAYAEQIHDCRVVARKLIDIYQAAE